MTPAKYWKIVTLHDEMSWIQRVACKLFGLQAPVVRTQLELRMRGPWTERSTGWLIYFDPGAEYFRVKRRNIPNWDETDQLADAAADCERQLDAWSK